MFKFLSVIGLTLLLAGCNPVVYKLLPVTDGKESSFSRSLLQLEDEEVKIVTNFDDISGGCLGFFAVINNKSDSTITVSPADFYAEVYFTDSIEKEDPQIVYALDPDEEIELIHKDIEQLEKEKGTTDQVNCCLFGTVAVVSVATAVTDKSEEGAEAREDALEGIVNKIEDDEADYQDKKTGLEQDKQFWQREVLLTTSIKPGDKAAGLFFIPFNRKAKWIKVVIPVGEKEYLFNYRQVKEN